MTYGVILKADKISLQFVSEGPYTNPDRFCLYMMNSDTGDETNKVLMAFTIHAREKEKKWLRYQGDD